MTNDILDDLARLRPDLEELDEHWPATARAELAERILRDDAGAAQRRLPRVARRRFAVAAGLVAAAVVAAVSVPSLLPAGSPGSASPAAAAALNRLARIVADTPADTVGPGQYLHLVVQETLFGDVSGNQKLTTVTSNPETWTGSKGQVWQRIRGGETDFFPAHDGDTAYLASLPTDPDALRRYLRGHVSGSDSTDEAVFVAIGDLLRGGNVPGALRSAMVTVLARTDHVTLGPAKTDWHGRTVEEFDFVDDAQRPGTVESLFFDPHTAALLDERTTNSDGSVSASSVLVSQVVDSVPLAVRRAAVRQP